MTNLNIIARRPAQLAAGAFLASLITVSSASAETKVGLNASFGGDTFVDATIEMGDFTLGGRYVDGASDHRASATIGYQFGDSFTVNTSGGYDFETDGYFGEATVEASDIAVEGLSVRLNAKLNANDDLRDIEADASLRYAPNPTTMIELKVGLTRRKPTVAVEFDYKF